ncbi:MAG: dihydrodipicolinate synthase family protein, partial [Lentisphaeria bacterium]|nr:dihydrodipicolinate synthase family protein [Lentisphaeria bacterium]
MEIKGICPIAPAVYDDRGAVDIDDYMRCCEKLIAHGAQTLPLFGIAGEYYTMDTDEEEKLIASTVKVCHEKGAG